MRSRMCARMFNPEKHFAARPPERCRFGRTSRMEAKLQEKPGKAIVSHPCYVRVGICTSDGPTGMPYEDIGLFLFDKRIRMPIERNFFVVSAEAEGLIGVRDGLLTPRIGVAAQKQVNRNSTASLRGRTG